MGFLEENQTNGSLLQERKLQPICTESVPVPRPSLEESTIAVVGLVKEASPVRGQSTLKYQREVIPGVQGWFNIRKLLNITQ